MTRYMLDTNTVSHLLRGHPVVAQRIVSVPMTALCISAMTQGELLFGLARRPAAKRLHAAVREFLKRMEVLPWDSAIAERCGTERAVMERQGKTLAPLDLLIATRALATGIVLVTNNQAFGHMTALSLQDWTA